MIAMALANEPKLLIADEPTTALDVTIQAQILALLDDLKDRLGMAMLLITHDMGVIAGHADRVNVMYAGRIVETADIRDLFSHMHHPYTQALLASIPRLTQESAEALHAIPGLPPDLAHLPQGCRFAARCTRATDKCRETEPSLNGKTAVHLFSCWHPVDGPLALKVVGPGGPDAASIGLDLAGAAMDAETEAEAGPVTDAPDETPVVDVALADLPTAAPVADGGRARVTERVPGKGQATGNGHADGSGRYLLEISDLVKEFPVTSGGVLKHRVSSVKAVSGVSFGVPEGQTLGLVGESGCGKTTIGRMIVALERPDRGSVTLRGQNVSRMRGGELRRVRRDLQLMFQDPYSSLDPRMRVGAIIREPLSVQHIGSGKEQQDRVFELLGEVGLPRNAVERYPHEFSGGQRQRIGLARALTVSPRVIVADEPVSALDVSIRAQVLNLMKRLQAVARPDLRGDLPRPRRGQVHGRPDRRHVPGQAGRDGLGGRHLRARGAPVHRRADRHDPGAGTGTRKGQDRGRHPGRAAQLDQPAVRLPVPHPVPVRAGTVRRAGTRTALLRSRSRRRLPLPAADPRPGRHRVGCGCPGQDRAGCMTAGPIACPRRDKAVILLLWEARRRRRPPPPMPSARPTRSATRRSASCVSSSPRDGCRTRRSCSGWIRPSVPGDRRQLDGLFTDLPRRRPGAGALAALRASVSGGARRGRALLAAEKAALAGTIRDTFQPRPPASPGPVAPAGPSRPSCSSRPPRAGSGPLHHRPGQPL